ncbi:hypothetical protein ACIPUD_21150 [Bradyrhizobium sp. CAR08]
MLLFILWIVLTGIVAAAAEARGRSGLGWFIVAFLLSPLVGILLLLVFPNLKHERLLQAAVAGRQEPRQVAAPRLPKASLLGRADRVIIDRRPRPFEPDGVYSGVPYRVEEDGSIHAIMQGSVVRFANFDKFTGALS